MKTHKTVLNEKQAAYNALLEVTKIHGSMFMHFLTKVRKKEKNPIASVDFEYRTHILVPK